jgi:hypothetical protein
MAASRSMCKARRCRSAERYAPASSKNRLRRQLAPGRARRDALLRSGRAPPRLKRRTPCAPAPDGRAGGGGESTGAAAHSRPAPEVAGLDRRAPRVATGCRSQRCPVARALRVAPAQAHRLRAPAPPACGRQEKWGPCGGARCEEAGRAGCDKRGHDGAAWLVLHSAPDKYAGDTAN